MGQVNRKRLQLSVTSSVEISVVSKSGQRKLTLDDSKPPAPPIPLVKLPHSGRNITLGTADRLMQLCSSQLVLASRLVPSVYLRWDLVRLIWLYVPLLGSHRYVQSSGIPVLWCLRGLNFKDTDSLYSFHSNEGLGSDWREWTDTSLSQSSRTVFSSCLTCLHSSSLLLFLPLQLFFSIQWFPAGGGGYM